MQANKQSAQIALDGPSALLLYRDRSESIRRPKPATKRVARSMADQDDEQDLWLSDEDVAATLSQASIFGHSAEFTETEQSSDSFLPVLRPSQTRYLLQCSSRSRDLNGIVYEDFGLQPPIQSSPLFLLVSNSRQKWPVNNVRQRVLTRGFPRESFYCMDRAVYVPRPELTFLLMSHYLSLTGLMLVGMELCGHYRLMSASSRQPLTSSRSLYNKQALTSTAHLARYLERCKGIGGIKETRRALRYLANDSASPMESVVYLLLCLPRSLGGFAIRRPILNAKRAVNRSAKSFTLADHLVPDLYWPQYHLDVEYDSDEFHSDDVSLQAGARRTLALRSMNVEVFSLTYDVVNDTTAFEEFARMVTKRLGQRWRQPTEQELKRRKTLRADLLKHANVYRGALSDW